MENKVLIATRIKGKGDTWILINPNQLNKGIEFKSLTDTLEAYFQSIGKNDTEFILAPRKGELYALIEDNKQPPTKKFSIYDEQ